MDIPIGRVLEIKNFYGVVVLIAELDGNSAHSIHQVKFIDVNGISIVLLI